MPRLVGVGDLAGLLGVCRKTILAYARNGRLPPPIRLSGKELRWRREAIERAISRWEQEGAACT